MLYLTDVLPFPKASQATPHRGVIQVTSQNVKNKDDGTTGGVITLVPWAKDAGGAEIAPVPQSTVSRWVCGPATTNGVAAKYLPGSCRG